MFNSRLIRFISIVFLLTYFSGCTRARHGAHPRPGAESYFVHSVSVPGETLTLIAKWYTGSAQKWKVLADANPGLDAQKMHIGDQVRIPNTLMTNGAPLTRDIIVAYQQKIQSRKAAALQLSGTDPALLIESTSDEEAAALEEESPNAPEASEPFAGEKRDELIRKLLE